MSVMFTAACPLSGPVQRLASKYLLSEQMSKPILIPRIGHSQKLADRKPVPSLFIPLHYEM